MVAPMAAFLVSGQMNLGGMLFRAGGGEIARVASYEGKSFRNPNLTVEHVQASFPSLARMEANKLFEASGPAFFLKAKA
jgi:hypothetical protein